MNQNKAKIIILLSTYNGGNYINQQIESLINQDHKNINILIRDDGSTDNTVEILKSIEKRNDKISVIYGENIGVVKSFFELLKVSGEAEFYAFCDQDDFWEKDKLSRALNYMSKKSDFIPVLYGSSLTIVDENLNFIRTSKVEKIIPAFENSLLQNVITGCTMVLNQEAKKLLVREIPENIRMHDWWIYQVVSAFGEIIYDYESKILYRQHNNNTVGTNKNLIDKWINRIKRYRNTSYIIIHAKELRRIYSNDMPKDNLSILDEFLDGRKNLFSRLNYALTGKAYRQNLLDNLIFKVLIILNKV